MPETPVVPLTDDEVAEELALHSAIAKTRHDEILKETERVWDRLEALSQENLTRNTALETALAAELKALAAELKALRAELAALRESPVIPPSPPATPLVEPKPEDQKSVAVLVVPETVPPQIPVVPATPKKRVRI